VCCRRAAAVAAVQAVAAEAKTRHNWRSVMTQIATEYVADPHMYGDGSGTLKSWIEGAQNLHPSRLPAAQYTHLSATVRKWRQTLNANALSTGSAAGGAAGSASAPSRAAHRAHAMDEPIAEDEPTPVGGLTPHPDSPVKSATELKDGDYRDAWKWCLAEMRKELTNRTRCRRGYGPAVIVQRAKKLFAKVPSERTVEQAFKDNIESPPKRGKTTHMPEAVSQWCLETLKAFRKHKLIWPKTKVIAQARLLITGTIYENLFAIDMNDDDASVKKWDAKKLDRWYLDHFLTLEGVRKGAQRSLDAQRLNWCTPENFADSYKIYEDVHVEAEIAHYNEEYDPKMPLSERIKWIPSELYRSASFDETGLESDTSPGNRHNKSEATMKYGEDDDGECLSGRGAARLTGVGGYYNDSQPIVPGFILPVTEVPADFVGLLPSVTICGQKKTGFYDGQVWPTRHPVQLRERQGRLRTKTAQGASYRGCAIGCAPRPRQVACRS
jgi:hypothetical protein